MEESNLIPCFRDAKIDLQNMVAKATLKLSEKQEDVITDLKNFCNVMNEKFAADPVYLNGNIVEIYYNCDDASSQIVRSTNCDSIIKYDYNKRTHVNQVQTAMQVVPGIIRNNYIINKKNQHILVNGATQAGKTGVLVTFLHACALRNFVHDVVGTGMPKILSVPWTPKRIAIQEGLQNDYNNFINVHGEITVNIFINGQFARMETVKGLHNREEKQREEAFIGIRKKCGIDPVFKASIGDPNFIKWEETMDFHRQNINKLRQIMIYMKTANYLIVPVGDEMHWGAGDDTQMDKLFTEICEVFDKEEHFWIGVTATEEMYSNAGNVKMVDFIFPDNVTYTGMPYKKGRWMHSDKSLVIEPEVVTYEELSCKAYTGIRFLSNLSDECFKSEDKYRKFWRSQNEGKNRLAQNASVAADEAGTNMHPWYSNTDNRNFRNFGLDIDDHDKYRTKFISALAGFANWCFNIDSEPTRKSGRGIIIRVKTNAIARDMRSMLITEIEKMQIAGKISQPVKITIYNADSQSANLENHLTENLDDSQRISDTDKFIVIVSGAARMAERVPSYVKWGLHLSNHTSIDCDAMLQDIPGRLTGYNKGKTLIVLSQNGGTWLKSYIHAKGNITLKPKNTQQLSQSHEKDVEITVDKLIELGNQHGCLQEVKNFLEGFNKKLKELCDTYYRQRPIADLQGNLKPFRLGNHSKSQEINDLIHGKIGNLINTHILKDGRKLLLAGEEVGNRGSTKAKYSVDKPTGLIQWHARPSWSANPDAINTDVGSSTETFKVSVKLVWIDELGNICPRDNIAYVGYAVATSFSFRTNLDTSSRGRGRPRAIPISGVPYRSQSDQQLQYGGN